MRSFFDNGGYIGQMAHLTANDQYQIGTTQVSDTLVYVGGMINTSSGAATGTTVSFNLTGGIATTPAANDLVVIAYCCAIPTGRATPTLSITGYTGAFTQLVAADTVTSVMRVFYKLMGATPDTTFFRSGTGTAGDGGALIVHVWRNVDTTTPIDVTPATNQIANTAFVNPPAITPITANSVILVAGAAAHTAGNFVHTASYLSNFRTANINTTYDPSIGLGSVLWTSGSYDPAAWTFGATDSTNYSYTSATLALRPRLVSVPVYGNYKNSGMWNMKALYDARLYLNNPERSSNQFNFPGSVYFQVPAGVFEISAMCVGGGGGGSGGDGGRGEVNRGGGGGGCAYGTFAVTPGELLLCTVGAGGTTVSGSSGTAGGASSISRGATVLLQGGGGAAGLERTAGSSAGGTSTGTERDGGGTGGSGGAYTAASGGSGGGGAGGIGGNGGNGGLYNGAGTAAATGSNAGGGGGGVTGTTAGTFGGGGGGASAYGVDVFAYDGQGGALGGYQGETGGIEGGYIGNISPDGLFPGGGGGGRSDSSGIGGVGADGMIRIAYGPGVSYPSSNTG